MQTLRGSYAYAVWLALGQGGRAHCHCVLVSHFSPWPAPFLTGAETCSLSMPRCGQFPSLNWLSSSSQLYCGKWRAQVPNHQISPVFYCCLLEKRSWHFTNALWAWSEEEIVDNKSITALSRSPQAEPSFCFLPYLHLVSYWSLS